MHNTLGQTFIQTTRDVFSFLTSYGYVFDDKSMYISTLLVKVRFVGPKTAFLFTLDLRDELVECYIETILNTNVFLDKRENIERIELFQYLIKYKKFRGRIGCGEYEKNESIEKKIEIDLNAYAKIIKMRCHELLNSSEFG